MGEGKNVLLALTQRGQRERHHVQAVEQILAEPAGPYLLFEIPVRGGNQADIRLAFARLAESFIGPIVEESKEARLSVGRQVANFIEQQRSALRFLHFAGHVGDRPCESAFTMTKEGARHEVAG